VAEKKEKSPEKKEKSIENIEKKEKKVQFEKATELLNKNWDKTKVEFLRGICPNND